MTKKKIITLSAIIGTASLGVIFGIAKLMDWAFNVGYNKCLKSVNAFDAEFEKAAFDTGYWEWHDEKREDFERACAEQGTRVEFDE